MDCIYLIHSTECSSAGVVSSIVCFFKLVNKVIRFIRTSHHLHLPCLSFAVSRPLRIILRLNDFLHFRCHLRICPVWAPCSAAVTLWTFIQHSITCISTEPKPLRYMNVTCISISVMRPSSFKVLSRMVQSPCSCQVHSIAALSRQWFGSCYIRFGSWFCG